MSTKVTRDSSNKWFIYIDWSDWITEQAKASPNGPALTISIQSASWAEPATIIEESETALVGNIAYFVGSGGANDTDYDLICTITYTASELSATDLTQDQTITVRLRNQ